IDPRYDPAFQRGYDGSASRTDADSARHTPRVTSALQRSIGMPPGPARGAEPAHTVSPASMRSPSTADSSDAAPEHGADAAHAAPSVVHVTASAPRPPWTNPFVVLIA